MNKDGLTEAMHTIKRFVKHTKSEIKFGHNGMMHIEGNCHTSTSPESMAAKICGKEGDMCHANLLASVTGAIEAMSFKGERLNDAIEASQECLTP